MVVSLLFALGRVLQSFGFHLAKVVFRRGFAAVVTLTGRIQRRLRLLWFLRLLAAAHNELAGLVLQDFRLVVLARTDHFRLRVETVQVL